MPAVRSADHLGATLAQKRSGVSRRQLLKAGAWAAPVILLATSIPAAAASGPVADVEGAAVIFDNFTINGLGDLQHATPPHSGTSAHADLVHGNFQLFYEPGGWGSGLMGPSSLTVTYILTLDGTTVPEASGTVTITRWGSAPTIHWEVPTLPHGAHTVTFLATAVLAYDDQGRTFQAAPLTISATVTT